MNAKLPDLKIDLPKMPEFKVNSSKNGYEIRTEVLEMAKDYIVQDFYVKWHGWELSTVKDEKTGQLVSKVEMPEFPGLEDILSTAERMYSFISNGTTSKK